MNYRELYDQARALTLPREEIFKDEGTFKRNPKLDAHARALGIFIPTGFPLLDRIVANTKPNIKYGPQGTDPAEPPLFDPTEDALYIPAPNSFVSPEEYAHVLSHELSHWVRAKGRAPRLFHKEVDKDPDLTFSLNLFVFLNGAPPTWITAIEELAAEISASIIREKANIGTSDQSLRYIRAWLENFKDDTKDALPNSERWLELAGKDGERSAAWLLAQA